jgi:hypothetical protein
MGTGLTGLCPELALDQGELAYVQGELLCALVVCALCLSMVFVSDVSIRCPCLRVRDLSSSSDLVLCLSRLSIACWSFSFCFFSVFLFLQLPNVCVINALIKGEIEDHVWFEDRWMVASLCDE